MSGVLGRNLIRPGLAIGMMFVRVVLVSTFLRSLTQCFRNIGDGFYGLSCRCRRLDGVGCTMLIALGVHIMIMMMFVIMRMLVFVVVMMMRRFIVVVGGVVMMRAIMDVMDVVIVVFVGVCVSILRLRRRLRARILHDLALNPFAMAAPARAAVARTAAAGAIFGFFFRFPVGALVGFDQRLTIGDRYLIIIGMNFAEGQEAMAIATIFDEGGLQRRFDPRDLGEINIAAQLFALRGLEIKFFDAVAADDDDPGLLRVGGIDKHLVGHFGTLDGDWRAGRRAQIARPGDATVHLIRG